MSCDISAAGAADVAAGVRFYNSQPSRLGTAFHTAVERAMARIGQSPWLYPPVEDGVPGLEIREFYIARFQQRVIYLMNGDEALVIAVVHASRRPESWHRNLPTDT